MKRGDEEMGGKSGAAGKWQAWHGCCGESGELAGMGRASLPMVDEEPNLWVRIRGEDINQ